MYFFGFFLVSLLFSANARFHPIDYNFISNFDTNGENTAVNYRLPNNTKPSGYGITLRTRVDKGEFNFTGNVVIYLEVLKENTSTITLHARKLTIAKVVLKTGISVIATNEPTYDEETEFLTIPLTSDKLLVGKSYELSIDYMGELREDLGGFYRSSYKNANNETKWLATTQFEATDARHAFPCYDEPQLKASFIIHIEHGSTYSAISNMAVQGTPVAGESEGTLKTTFAETGKMSTYLIAFIVSDFKYTEAKKSDDNPVAQRVFAQPDYVNQTEYALAEGVAILNALAKYVNVPYLPKENVDTPKMDQAAIPQFKAGAMENWGLVTYREEMLLFDAAIHLPKRQLSITTTIAHEFAHQWFGDLVSPLWWSYIWLNEGFATIFEAIGTNAVHPTWDIWAYFVSSKVQPVLIDDAESNSRPMTYYVENAADVQRLFDQIAYAKSGSVIRMFMHALGEETFKKGLNYYLKNMSHAAANEDDLFNHLTVAAHDDESISAELTVNELFYSWSHQIGFPLLKVNRSEDGSIGLSQEKYDAVPQQNNTSKSLWWIPYNFGSASNPNLNDTKASGWLTNNQTEQIIEWKENESKWNKSDWVLFNTQQTGYYRVWYDDSNYDLLNKELNEGEFEKTIHPLNRAQILDDLQAFVLSGRVSAKTLCNTMTYLEREKSYAPWDAARRAIAQWKKHLQASEKLDTFHKVVRTLVAPYYKQVKLIEDEKDEILDKLARNMAVNLACEFGVPECLDETYSEFQKIISGNKTSQNVRGIIVGNGIRKANADEIEKLWNKFLDTQSNDERGEIISSLGNIAEESLEIYLKKSIEDFEGKTVSAAERTQIITTISGSGQKGVSLTIDFLKSELANVNKTTNSVPSILNNVANRILTEDMFTKFTELLDLAKTGKFIDDSKYKDLQEIVSKEIQWQKDNLKTFEDNFFVDKCAGAATLAATPLLSFILFAITRWNWL